VLQEIVPSKHANRADELIGLEDALEAMPENQRRAILLREWQGLSYREIADELELSQAAVETLIFRARRSLANGLESPVTPKKRRRISAAFDGVSIGSAIASLKTILTGGAAIKAVAVAVAAGSATVAATQAEPALVHHFQHTVKPAQTVHVTKQSQATFSSQATVVASRSGMSVAQAQAKTGRGVSLHDAVATTQAPRLRHAPVSVARVQTPPMVPRGARARGARDAGRGHACSCRSTDDACRAAEDRAAEVGAHTRQWQWQRQRQQRQRQRRQPEGRDAEDRGPED